MDWINLRKSSSFPLTSHSNNASAQQLLVFFNIKSPTCMNGAFNLAIHPITNFIALFLKLKHLLRGTNQRWKAFLIWHPIYERGYQVLWKTHLVSRFACNTRMIDDVSSSSPFLMSNSKPKIISTSKQTKINIISSINQTVIRYGGKSHRVAFG